MTASSKTVRVATVRVALAAALVFSAADAGAYVVKHAKSGAVVRWNRAEVDFVLSPTLDDAAPGARSAATKALSAWSQLAPNVPAIATHDGDGSESPGYDGKNTVYFAKNGFAPAGKALAVTVLSFDSSSGEILDSDIVLTSSHAFAVLPDDARCDDGTRPMSTEIGGDDGEASKAFDLVHVFAHETGHALGLGDEANVSGALMYPYSFPGDARMRAPMGDDATGLSVAYATAPDASGATTASHHGCAASGRAPGAAWSIGGVALLFPAFSRRARKRTRRALLVATPLAVPAGALLPTGKARASMPPPRMESDAARARVTSAVPRWAGGLVVTKLSFADGSSSDVWGGTIDGITQIVGEPLHCDAQRAVVPGE